MKENLERIIKFRFMKKVLEDLDEDRTNELHTTDLVYDCMRRCYYVKKYGKINEMVEDMKIGAQMNEEQMIIFWIGKKLHETEITDMHEYEVEYKGIKGSIDEVMKIGEEYVIIDKKTTRVDVKKAYEHHIKQVEMYSAMLWHKTGINAKYGAIIYINVKSNNVSVFVFDLPENKEAILKEMEMKKELLEKALRENKVPEAKPSWLCQYCSYYEQCIRDGV